MATSKLIFHTFSGGGHHRGVCSSCIILVQAMECSKNKERVFSMKMWGTTWMPWWTTWLRENHKESNKIAAKRRNIWWSAKGRCNVEGAWRISLIHSPILWFGKPWRFKAQGDSIHAIQAIGQPKNKCSSVSGTTWQKEQASSSSMGVSDQQMFVLHGSAFQAIFHNNNLRRSCIGTAQIFLQSSAPREVAGVKPVGRNRVVFHLLLHLKTHFNSSWTHLALLILVLKAQILLGPITVMDRLDRAIVTADWQNLFPRP